MPLEDRWTKLDAAEMEELARGWLQHCLTEPSDDDPDEVSVGDFVVMMGFTAPADQQWAFILAAVSQATTDDQLAHIAAGPVECLLSRHGDTCIDRVEEQARSDARFAKMLGSVWRHLMSDEVWSRVEQLKRRP